MARPKTRSEIGSARRGSFAPCSRRRMSTARRRCTWSAFSSGGSINLMSKRAARRAARRDRRRGEAGGRQRQAAARLCAARRPIGHCRGGRVRSGCVERAGLARRGGHPAAAASAAILRPHAGGSHQRLQSLLAQSRADRRAERAPISSFPTPIRKTSPIRSASRPFLRRSCRLKTATTIDKLVAGEAKRIEQEREPTCRDQRPDPIAIRKRAARPARCRRPIGARTAHNGKRDEIVPNWLLFDSARDREGGDLSPEELAARQQSRKCDCATTIKFRFSSSARSAAAECCCSPAASFSSWNDLPTKNAIWLIDRILRSRIEYTLPERNVDTSSKPIVVPINAAERNEQFYLVRPNGKEQLLEVERIGRDEFGVTVSDFAQRGLYRVAIRKPQSGGRTCGHCQVRTKAEAGKMPAENEIAGRIDCRQRPGRRIEARRDRRGWPRREAQSQMARPHRPITAGSRAASQSASAARKFGDKIPGGG